MAAAGGFRRFSSSAVCLMLPSNKMYRLGEKKVVNIVDIGKELMEWNTRTSTSVVGSSHGWVGLMKDRSSLSLWNPMSGHRMKLPPLLAQVEKLVVDGEECSRAIVTSNWLGLGVCCPGRSSVWTRFGHDYTQYEDVVAHSPSRVYSLNCLKLMARWDVSDPRKPRIAWEKYLGDIGYDDDLEEKSNFPRKPDHLWCYKITHLVHAEHSGQIFIVTRHYAAGMDMDVDEELWNFYVNPMKTVAFDVHLLVEDENESAAKLRYMEHSLDGLVMFVGVNNSFAVAAADFPHLNPDSIYFTDHHSSRSDHPVDSNSNSNSNSISIYGGGHDTGIYDYKNRTISSCYYPTHYHRFKTIDPHPPFWFTPSRQR